jgi:hypothetical protein
LNLPSWRKGFSFSFGAFFRFGRLWATRAAVAFNSTISIIAEAFLSRWRTVSLACGEGDGVDLIFASTHTDNVLINAIHKKAAYSRPVSSRIRLFIESAGRGRHDAHASIFVLSLTSGTNAGCRDRDQAGCTRRNCRSRTSNNNILFDVEAGVECAVGRDECIGSHKAGAEKEPAGETLSDQILMYTCPLWCWVALPLAIVGCIIIAPFAMCQGCLIRIYALASSTCWATAGPERVGGGGP